MSGDSAALGCPWIYFLIGGGGSRAWRSTLPLRTPQDAASWGQLNDIEDPAEQGIKEPARSTNPYG